MQGSNTITRITFEICYALTSQFKRSNDGLRADCTDILGSLAILRASRSTTHKVMFSNNVDDFSEWFLKEYQTIEYDIFFSDINKVREAIKMNNLIKKGEFLNGTEMDTDNYYLLTYNMYETIDELI